MGFERIKNIAPGESRSVIFDIPVRELAVYDVVGESLIVENGKYEIMAGSSSLHTEVSAIMDIEGVTPGLRDLSKKIKADHYDEENGSQIVQGMYGYNALMAEGPNVYEPCSDGKFSAVYANCDISEKAQFLRIHGFAPENAQITVYIDGVSAGNLTCNTYDHEKNHFGARNHMPRAAKAEEQRKKSWPVLWADIRIPLDLSMLSGKPCESGHKVCIEAKGPFKYDWFSVI
ncbi:MAG: fibronectin type III-like domain-contianing protein [Lachnospiraceae bacterium]|nr:fibronectin type III-like domain-contianing protein [Lachnospiraceae bacterium]